MRISSYLECKYLGTQTSEFDGNFFLQMVKYNSLNINFLASHCGKFVFFLFRPYACLDHCGVMKVDFNGKNVFVEQ